MGHGAEPRGGAGLSPGSGTGLLRRQPVPPGAGYRPGSPRGMTATRGCRPVPCRTLSPQATGYSASSRIGRAPLGISTPQVPPCISLRPPPAAGQLPSEMPPSETRRPIRGYIRLCEPSLRSRSSWWALPFRSTTWARSSSSAKFGIASSGHRHIGRPDDVE
jgi:hypothetical protein